MKKILAVASWIYFAVAILAIALPHAAAAQNLQYVPIAPIGNQPPGTPVKAGDYIVNLFKAGVGIAAGLAVIRIAWGGIKYMLSDVVTTKSAAKETISHAFWGLLLAICAYLILYTINPNLVNFSF